MFFGALWLRRAPSRRSRAAHQAASARTPRGGAANDRMCRIDVVVVAHRRSGTHMAARPSEPKQGPKQETKEAQGFLMRFETAPPKGGGKNFVGGVPKNREKPRNIPKIVKKIAKITPKTVQNLDLEKFDCDLYLARKNVRNFDEKS